MTGRHKLLLAFLAFLLLSLGALPVYAQDPGPSAFRGVVLDEQGQPLVGATVSFRNRDIGLVREIQTQPDGRFYYGGFPAGRYLVSVHHNNQLLWSFPVQVPPEMEIQLEIDLKKLREMAESLTRLDPELERRRNQERARREHRDQIERLHRGGVRELDAGNPAQAIEQFEKVLEMEPDRAVTQAMLAAAYAEAGEREKAVASYRRAVELEPDEAAHYNNLAVLLLEENRLEEALNYFRRAARLDPSRRATYRFNAGAALLNAGRLEEAQREFSEAVKRDPTMAVAHYFLGVALFRRSPREGERGRVEPLRGTVDAFRRYLQLEPDGEYAEQARDYLRQLGALPREMLLPPVDPGDLHY